MGKMKISPSDGTYRTFCDLLTSYRLATAVRQSVKSGIIELIGKSGRSQSEIISASGLRINEGQRFLDMLVNTGVLEKYSELYYLSRFSRKFLYSQSEFCQLDVIEFEQILLEKWCGLDSVLVQGQGNVAVQAASSYQQRLDMFHGAMRGAATIRARELWEAIDKLPDFGVIIDVGAGDGSYLNEFLKRHPGWKAVACDLEGVLAKIDNRDISTYSCNLIEQGELETFTDVHRDTASVVLLSNVIHCYSNLENRAILESIGHILKSGGLLIVHDFFTNGNAFSSIYDIHMMVNTYNGQTYSFDETRMMLTQAGFQHTELIELQSYSHAMLATRNPGNMGYSDPILTFRHKAYSLGFIEAVAIDPATIPIEPWVKAKCRYGCNFYGRKWSCPPHSMNTEEFRELLTCYSKTIVVSGQPPLKEFQQKLLELEKAAFLAGFKKALVFTGGPCCWCNECDDLRCTNPEKRRPSLESCGCDVFALADACGIHLKPVTSSDDFVQYIGMLLID